MKRLFFLTAFLIIPFSTVLAQKVKIKKGVVTVNKQPYCKMNCKGLLVTDCEIMSLDGKILASLVFHDLKDGDTDIPIYEIIFANSNYKAQIRFQFKYRHKLIKKLYQYEVFKDNKLNEAGVKNFTNAHPKDFLSQYGNPEIANQPFSSPKNGKCKLVKRNIDKKLLLFGKTIQQDFKKIGTYKHETFLDGSEIKQRFSFFLMDGTLVATGIMAQFPKDGACELTTVKDNKIKNITIEGDFENSRTKAIAKYLIKRYYL